MRAVLDTNVIVSAALNPGGTPGRIVAAAVAGQFDSCSSPALVAELREVLAEPRLLDRLGWSPQRLDMFIHEFSEATFLMEPAFTLDAVADDPTDNRVLEAAVASEVDYIVSGDRHLLSLGEYEGIPIVRPAQFLALLATV
jgi:uncharacterized protein